MAKQMKVLLYRSDKEKFEISYRGGALTIADTDMVIYCYGKDFTLPLYRKTVNQLVKVLSLVSDCPITIDFDDSETFNATINGLIL